MKKIEDIRFARTVWADIELAKLCPGNNINKLKQVVAGPDTAENLTNTMKVIVILSESYERKKHFEDPSYEMNPVTIEELQFYTEEEVMALSSYAFDDFDKDGKPTIEAVPKKENAE